MKTNGLFLGILILAAPAVEAQFDYITNDNAAIITGYSGPGGAVSIPSTLGGFPVTEIQGSGFEDKGITSIALPDSVTNIEVQEFAPNTLLTSFTVDTNNPAYSSSNGVLFDKTGTTLFEYPPGLAGSYAIPTNVTSVGQNAFSACYYLSGVTIPSSVTNIGPVGFGYCFDLTNILIPASVRNIGVDPFINCFNLPAITVAASNAFYLTVGGVLFDKNETTLLEYPTGLTGNYVIPNGVNTIGTNAFVLCDGLTGVTVPASVQNIADGAFADCNGLTNVTLGAGVTNLVLTAFGGCGALTAINVDPGNPDFSSVNGVVFNKNQTTLILFPPGFAGSYTTPASITSIAAYAFEDCKLADAIISSNVGSIGLFAFQGCGSLTNVTMSNGVTSIGEFAFGDCPQLASVTIPASVTSLPFGAFAYDGLNSILFEGNAPASGPQAFLGDSGTIYYLAGTSGWASQFDGLTTMIEDAPNPNGALQVTILPAGAAAAGAQWQVDGGVLQPSAAVVVGLSVGSHTISFTTIPGWSTPSNEMASVGAGVTNSDSGTYSEAASPATDFTFVTNGGGITITGYVGPGGAVAIPATINTLPVTQIAMEAFSSISTLSTVDIPDSVTNLGDYAFSDCTALAEVTLSSNISGTGTGTFENCFALTDVEFGAITSIGDYAFASCPALTDLTIPDGVTNIGQYTFFGGGLTNINIPASVISIGEAAFLECTQLPAINVDPANPAYTSPAGVLFNKNLTVLLAYPDGNPATSYIISNGVTSIGDTAFEGCRLARVSFPSSLTNIGNYSFNGCGFLTNVTLPGNLQSIGNAAFVLCSALTSIVIPASVTSIGLAPFANCGNMTSIAVASGNPAYSSLAGVLYNNAQTALVEFPGGPQGFFTIPNGVQDISAQAFEGCLISGVELPSSVTNIEFDGFFNCVNLQSVTATGLNSIGVAAFQDCYVLTTVVLPPSLGTVGGYAFSFSAALTSAYFAGNGPPDDGTVFDGDTNATVYYLPGATGWGSTFGAAPTVSLTGITATARPNNGVAPLAAGFAAAAVDGATNPVLNWNWNFGDGYTSAAQNPSHTYFAIGAFVAAVVETNGAGLPSAGRALQILSGPLPPVDNGGFETGTFAGWTLSGGDPADNYVVSALSGITPHSGSYFAALGSAGTNLSYLTQSLATTPSQQYVLTLWLNSPDGLGPNEFLVAWNGTTLFDETNLPALGWTNLQFIVTATSPNTVLQFGFRDDPSFLGLDDISVYPLQPQIINLGVTGDNLVLDAVNGQAGQAYLVLAGTNLTQPLSQWKPVATNFLNATGNFSITVANAIKPQFPQQFYVIQRQ